MLEKFRKKSSHIIFCWTPMTHRILRDERTWNNQPTVWFVTALLSAMRFCQANSQHSGTQLWVSATKQHTAS